MTDAADDEIAPVTPASAADANDLTANVAHALTSPMRKTSAIFARAPHITEFTVKAPMTAIETT